MCLGVHTWLRFQLWAQLLVLTQAIIFFLLHFLHVVSHTVHITETEPHRMSYIKMYMSMTAGLT